MLKSEKRSWLWLSRSENSLLCCNLQQSEAMILLLSVSHCLLPHFDEQFDGSLCLVRFNRGWLMDSMTLLLRPALGRLIKRSLPWRWVLLFMKLCHDTSVPSVSTDESTITPTCLAPHRIAVCLISPFSIIPLMS
mmetsp:Transcript_32563/g.98024  ORF Transcript_32563/g.98024 Transcript_32563/m.98024 type:complete len:135 (-) Transcript_32563:1491-1895(-)